MITLVLSWLGHRHPASKQSQFPKNMPQQLAWVFEPDDTDRGYGPGA